MSTLATDGYTPVWCKSNYSFLEGASHPEELVEQAHTLGLQSLALTDRDGVYGIVRAHVRARELGLHLIHGAQMTLTTNSQVVLLATNRGDSATPRAPAASPQTKSANMPMG